MAREANTVRYAMLLLLAMGIGLNETSAAAVFQVGGNQGWTVPHDPNSQPYNQWAENHRFQIGDSLLFVYQAGSDSVLQVNKDDYSSCNTASPIASFNDGRTKFTLDHAGAVYFISGVQDHCKNNEKLSVIVLADRSKSPSTNNGVSSSKMSGSLAILGALLGSSFLIAMGGFGFV